MKVECPHCNKMHDLELSACLPPEQKMVVTVKCETERMAADALGLLLTNTTKALRAVAKNAGGQVSVFVENVTVRKKEVRIDLFVTSGKSLQ